MVGMVYKLDIKYFYTLHELLRLLNFTIIIIIRYSSIEKQLDISSNLFLLIILDKSLIEKLSINQLIR